MSTVAALDRPKRVVDRPRLLSYMGRWGRARRWLPQEADRVIDVGCAFGYGSVALRLRDDEPRLVLGVERDRGHVELAARCFPWLPIILGDATSLPFADATVDGVVLLDVVEHMADPAAVLAEARRVLKPGGSLVVSVPHQGMTAFLDSNNIYERLRRVFRSWPPLADCELSAQGRHLHYTRDQLRDLLSPSFVVDRTARTGVGFPELVHLSLRVLFQGLLRWQSAYESLRWLPFLAYLIDDLIPAGPAGYHLAVKAHAV